MGNLANYRTVMPALRAVPITCCIADSSEVQLRSGILTFAISSTCEEVTLATFSLFGSPEPLSTPAAFFRSTAAGGVFVMNV